MSHRPPVLAPHKSAHTLLPIPLEPQAFRAAGLRTLEMEGTSDSVSQMSFPPAFPCHVILSWFVCFVFPTTLINCSVFVAYFPLKSGHKIMVHCASSSL